MTNHNIRPALAELIPALNDGMKHFAWANLVKVA